MMELIFVPENDSFAEAAGAYNRIWKEEGYRIVSAIESATGLNFKERSVTAAVYEGMSWSDPLKLRASYDEDTKKATLVHELLHRLSKDYLIKMPDKNDAFDLGQHKKINLVLYDLWCELFGKAFADRQVAIESGRTPMYKAAWDWALDQPRTEWRTKFADLVAQSITVPRTALK